MTSFDVVDFYRQMETRGVAIWIDGGWGVDALLGEQTRWHADLDIVAQEKDCGIAVAFLVDRGFREVPQDDNRPWNFVMANEDGKQIDFHVIVRDDEGNGRYGPQEAGDGMYPADALQGQGSIDGLPVRCISPKFQISSHTGYEFGETDVKDVTALSQKFDLDLPEEYLSASREADDR